MSSNASLPSDVARGAARALGEPGTPADLVEASRLGGGCIHPAVRLRSRSGAQAFLKWSPEPGPTGFQVEARGLEALRHQGGLRVPEVLGWEVGDEDRRGWLLLELVEEGPGGRETARRLGEGLAELHRPEPGRPAGWEEDGWLASLPQPNPGGLSWPDFWIEARLLPRWRNVSAAFPASVRRLWEQVMPQMDRILEGWQEEGLSLLHGDLWSGNVITDRGGRPVLIDPAVYRGHREVDLSMMELFGGFPAGAFAAYRETAPLVSGYEERRRDAYQLYPLLVHVELFGGSYVGGAEARIRRLASL